MENTLSSPPEPAGRCTNLYSETELLRLLGDYTADCVTFLGYKEDRFFSNLRLGLASLACCIAAYGCFFLPPLADPRVLRLCIVAFFGTLLLLLVVESIYVKNAIACFKNKEGKSFFIDSHLDRRTKDLTLAIRQNKNSLSVYSNVGKFFDSQGYLLIDTVYEHVCKLLQDFERGVTDTNKKEFMSIVKKKKKPHK
eukprot:XP_028355417.1 uncharacterized protein LOC114487724 isoform X2 [Physeter catodon]